MLKIPSTELRERMLPILLGQAAGLVCGIISVRLNSYLVAPADYGLYGIFVSLVPLGAGVVFAGLLKYVGRQWPHENARPGLLREVLGSAGRKTPWLVAAVAGVTVLGGFARPWLFGGLLLLTALLTALTQLAQNALQAARQNWRDLSITLAAAITRAFAPPLLYAASGAGVVALLGGFSLHAVITALVGVLLLGRHWARKPGLVTALPVTFEGPLFVTLALAGWAVAGFNRWIVAWRFGVETAGYFTLAANIATIAPSMLGTIMLQYFQPLWFRAEPDSAAGRQALFRQIDRIALVYAAGGLLLATAVWSVTPWLIGPLLSVSYTASLEFLLAAGFSTTAITTGFFYHALLLAVRREKACGPVDLAGAALLLTGGLAAALAGREWFIRWLLVSPLVPWLLNRPLAQRALLKPA